MMLPDIVGEIRNGIPIRWIPAADLTALICQGIDEAVTGDLCNDAGRGHDRIGAVRPVLGDHLTGSMQDRGGRSPSPGTGLHSRHRRRHRRPWGPGC